jgi:hypothetical protein
LENGGMDIYTSLGYMFNSLTTDVMKMYLQVKTFHHPGGARNTNTTNTIQADLRALEYHTQK